MTDTERIKGFLEGSPKEYGEILGWITTVVRSRLWEERVAPDDVIADTLMKLVLAFREDTFRLESSLKTHIQRITLYTLIDAARRQKRFVSMSAQTDPPDASTPFTRMVRKEELALVDRVLSMLPEGCRKLFGMVLDEKITCREIARREGTTEGAIKTRLSRCRDKASDILRRLS